MNHYTQLLYYIKQLAESDSLVNHVTQGNISEVDVDKMIVPTLVNVTVTGGSFTNGSTVNLDVEIACLAQRDINKEVRTDDFWLQDNEVDNMNETLAILNRLWLTMYKDFEKNNITASENPTLSPIIYGTAKILDGWVLTFTVEMPNTTINLCQPE
jgi:flagellar basal body P-ring protein FlgI